MKEDLAANERKWTQMEERNKMDKMDRIDRMR
jgi:hypothetical protein